MKYYQGDTIRFDVEADTGFNPDDLDFGVLIYKGCDQAYIPRTTMVRQDNGAYRGTIPSEMTAGMGTGRYDIEVLVRQGAGIVSIAKAQAFTLEESQIKKHLR